MKTQEFIDTDLVSSKDLSEGSSHRGPHVAQSRVEIDARVEQARQQMLELRRQQEDLERERQELESLRRREEEFENGKAEILDELSRTVVKIEQEEFDLNKRGATIGNLREVYQDYVRQLQNIRETEWTGDELKIQLSKAFSVVEAARAELNKGRAQLTFLGEGPIKPTDPVLAAATSEHQLVREEFNFVEEVQRGLARYLPLMVFITLALLLASRLWSK